MEANDDSEHLLPDTSILLGLSLDRWIDFFILVAVMSGMCYTFLVVTGFAAPTRVRFRRGNPCDPQHLLLVVAGLILGVSLAMARLRFQFRLGKNGDRERGLAWDPLNWLAGFFLYGVGVEVATLLWAAFVARTAKAAQIRPAASDVSGGDDNLDRAIPAPRSRNHLLRFSWFLLYAGSECLTNFCANRRDHAYEYYGPMRLTRLPSLHNMNKVYPHTDQMKILPRLGCSLSDGVRENGLEQPYIQATVDIGWGRRWGCRDQTDRWNTNRPSVPQCTTFICSPDAAGGVADACPCYGSEEEARNVTWACLSNEFNLTRLQANETFDRDQPPWEDPSWPSLWYYGSCDMAGGTSMDPVYVRKVMFNGQRQESFGLACLTFWLCLVFKTAMDRSKNGRSAAREESNTDHNRTLWAQLYRARLSSARQTTMYIGQQIGAIELSTLQAPTNDDNQISKSGRSAAREESNTDHNRTLWAQLYHARLSSARQTTMHVGQQISVSELSTLQAPTNDDNQISSEGN